MGVAEIPYFLTPLLKKFDVLRKFLAFRDIYDWLLPNNYDEFGI
jgi:hypothetical protein